MGQPSHTPQSMVLSQSQPTIFIYPSDLCSIQGSGSWVLICNMKSLFITQEQEGSQTEQAPNTPCSKTCPKPCPGGAPRSGQSPHHSQSPVRGQALESSLNPWLQGDGCMFWGRSELLHQMCLCISTTWKGSRKDSGCRSCWQYSKISIRWMTSVLANWVNA